MADVSISPKFAARPAARRRCWGIRLADLSNSPKFGRQASRMLAGASAVFATVAIPSTA